MAIYSFFDQINLANNAIADFYEFSTNPINHDTSFLNLHNNRLQKLPNSIGNYSNLRTLILTQNYIKELPEAFRYLTSVTSLCIQQNELASNGQKNVLENVGYLTALEYFDASCGAHIGVEYSYCYEQFSTTTTGSNICNQGIRTLPSTFNNLVHLKQLILIDVTSFISLGQPVCNLTALENLYLKGTSVTGVPECFGNLGNLKFLNLESLKYPYRPFQFCSNKQINKLQNVTTIMLQGGMHLFTVPNFFTIRHLQDLELGPDSYVRSFDITPYCELSLNLQLEYITIEEQYPIKFLPDCHVTRKNFESGNIDYIGHNRIYCPLPNWYYKKTSPYYKCCKSSGLPNLFLITIIYVSSEL